MHFVILCVKPWNINQWNTSQTIVTKTCIRPPGTWPRRTKSLHSTGSATKTCRYPPRQNLHTVNYCNYMKICCNKLQEKRKHTKTFTFKSINKYQQDQRQDPKTKTKRLKAWDLLLQWVWSPLAGSPEPTSRRWQWHSRHSNARGSKQPALLRESWRTSCDSDPKNCGDDQVCTFNFADEGKKLK